MATSTRCPNASGPKIPVCESDSPGYLRFAASRAACKHEVLPRWPSYRDANFQPSNLSLDDGNHACELPPYALRTRQSAQPTHVVATILTLSPDLHRGPGGLCLPSSGTPDRGSSARRTGDKEASCSRPLAMGAELQKTMNPRQPASMNSSMV